MRTKLNSTRGHIYPILWPIGVRTRIYFQPASLAACQHTLIVSECGDFWFNYKLNSCTYAGPGSVCVHNSFRGTYAIAALNTEKFVGINRSTEWVPLGRWISHTRESGSLRWFFSCKSSVWKWKNIAKLNSIAQTTNKSKHAKWYQNTWFTAEKHKRKRLIKQLELRRQHAYTYINWSQIECARFHLPRGWMVIRSLFAHFSLHSSGPLTSRFQSWSIAAFVGSAQKSKREKHSSKSIGLIAVVMLVSHENTVTVITEDEKCTFFYFRHRHSIILPSMRDVPHKMYADAFHLFAFGMETRNSSFSKHEEIELCSPFNTFYRSHKENQKAKRK